MCSQAPGQHRADTNSNPSGAVAWWHCREKARRIALVKVVPAECKLGAGASPHKETEEL